MASDKRFTAHELLRLPDVDCFRELVRGEIQDRPVNTPWHGYICGNILSECDAFVAQHKLGCGFLATTV